ncbi:MAG: hypothetical protein A2Z04_02425 [Chloroflexi bacterium RBG_16_57_9]|nr:MAG: hypothetical protein A2Z04_02425 [Chloroflexi bacterium RBG_16_57_9]
MDLEEGLVERAKRDAAAFGELYDRYVDRIYNYFYHRTGNHHDAEDLTAHTFYKALAHIASYTDRGVPFSAWLYRIAHNLVANWHRDQSRRQTTILDDGTPAGGKTAPDHLTSQREEQQVLNEAIRRLPPDRQQLLILKFTDEMSNAEIGKLMGRTEGAIKSLYHRTLLALREDLAKRGFIDNGQNRNR